MLAQQQSPWEQLWSKDEKCLYYYNKIDGTSFWEEPGEPYRPMVRDSYTGKLIQAWPYLDWPPVAEKKAAKGRCMKCFTREASRRCNTCFFKKSKDEWNKGYGYYCFGCYADLHKDGTVLREHGFTIVKPEVPPKLKCTVCGVPATRHCHGIKITAKTRERLEMLAADAHLAEGLLNMEAFTRITMEKLQLDFSYKKIEMLFRQCTTEEGSQRDVWVRLGKLLDDHQEPCDDNYCKKCWIASHKKGQRAKHRWEGFQEGWVSCASCEKLPARRLCETCEDNLCEACFVAAHIRGRKRYHPFVALQEKAEPEERSCAYCNWRIGTEDCDECHQWLCDSCYTFNHLDECKARKDAGAEKHAIACVVCGDLPDIECVECGDVYCSKRAPNNPGCFAKMHRRGNRKQHSKRTYSFAQELKALHDQRMQAEAEAEKRRLRDGITREEAKQSINRRVQQIIQRKQEIRERKLVEEAHKEYHRRMREKAIISNLVEVIHKPQQRLAAGLEGKGK